MKKKAYDEMTELTPEWNNNNTSSQVCSDGFDEISL